MHKDSTHTKKRLKGITWDHSRGFVPMLATSQRFSEMYPEVEIAWHKRTLQEFADQSIGMLAEAYDLIVLDHPWIGLAAEEALLVPLEAHLPRPVLEELERASAGLSYESYRYRGSQWALPIDAATPVASYRPDLLNERGLGLPKTYEQLLELAEKGGVIVPGIAIDALMHFFMYCCSLGEPPFASADKLVTEQTGTAALRMLKELMDRVDRRCFDWNPVKVYEMMAGTDEFVYCPFAYGYSNYARRGYARKRLNFHDLVSLDGHGRLIPILGGTGIAVSSRTTHLETALAYLRYVSDAECQQTLYFDNGGQPSHLGAWTDFYTNFKCAGFFKATLPAMKRSFLRPTYAGYTNFQDAAGPVVRDYIQHGGSERKVLTALCQLYDAKL